MTGPVRLQLSRRKDFNLQELSLETNGLPAVNVARPTMWGNHAAKAARVLIGQPAVDIFRRWLETTASDAWKGRARIDLRGKNLACWCKPGAPCHADVLLEIANRSSLESLNKEQVSG